MRDSVGLLDQAKAYSETKITVNDIHDINGTITTKDLKELLENMNENNLEKILEKTDKYNEKGKNFTKLTEELINFMRNIILYKKVPEYFRNKHKNIELYKEISQKVDIKDLFYYIETLNKYSLEMKNTSNTKLMFELMLIQMLPDDEEPQLNAEKPDIIVKELEKPLDKEQKKENELEKEQIQTQQTEEKTTINNEKKEKELNHIKKIRIDNTLSKFNKVILKEIIKKLEKLNEFLLNPDYSHAASILLDGSLKAASEDSLIFVYKNPRIATLFNENLLKIEETIEEALDKKYRLIATDIDEWEIIKDEFNNKKRKFIYQEEDFDIEKILKIEKDEIATMFEDIIEYN